MSILIEEKLGTATYLMLWPEDGRMMKVCSFFWEILPSVPVFANLSKEDVRAVYDGSIFHRIAEKREKKLQQQKQQKNRKAQ